jgi:hypothetical protein
LSVDFQKKYGVGFDCVPTLDRDALMRRPSPEARVATPLLWSRVWRCGFRFLLLFSVASQVGALVKLQARPFLMDFLPPGADPEAFIAAEVRERAWVRARAWVVRNHPLS